MSKLLKTVALGLVLGVLGFVVMCVAVQVSTSSTSQAVQLGDRFSDYEANPW